MNCVLSEEMESSGPGHAKVCLMPYANNIGADQPISTFVVRFLNSTICILTLSKVSTC